MVDLYFPSLTVKPRGNPSEKLVQDRADRWVKKNQIKEKRVRVREGG